MLFRSTNNTTAEVTKWININKIDARYLEMVKWLGSVLAY